MRQHINSFELLDNLDGLDKWLKELERQSTNPFNFLQKSLIEQVRNLAEHRLAFEGPLKCTKEGMASILEVERLLDGAGGDLVRVKMVHRLSKKEQKRVCNQLGSNVLEVKLDELGDDKSLVERFTDSILLIAYSIPNISDRSCLNQYIENSRIQGLINRDVLEMAVEDVFANMNSIGDPDLKHYQKPQVLAKLMKKYLSEPCHKYIKQTHEVLFIYGRDSGSSTKGQPIEDTNPVLNDSSLGARWARSDLCRKVIAILNT